MEPELAGVDCGGNVKEHEFPGVAGEYKLVAVGHGDAVGDPEGALLRHLLPHPSIQALVKHVPTLEVQGGIPHTGNTILSN